MAPPNSCSMPWSLAAVLSLLFQSFLGAALVCEDLPTDTCAFAVSSSSKRCVLESYQRSGAPTEYKCRTSEAVVGRISDYVETNTCVSACGVDRKWVGISSDALLEAEFMDKLCSPDCFQNCANIIDLYFNLADGEGMFLPDLCQAHRTNPYDMSPTMSPGAATSPTAADRNAASPTVSPAASPTASQVENSAAYIEEVVPSAADIEENSIFTVESSDEDEGSDVFTVEPSATVMDEDSVTDEDSDTDGHGESPYTKESGGEEEEDVEM